jgi:hypothetical protein
MTSINLPPLSASSQLTPSDGGRPKSFYFKFSIHDPSGALLLTPVEENGLLEAVRNAKHREPEKHLEAASDLLIEALQGAQLSHISYYVRGLTDKDQTLVATLCRRLNSSSAGLILLSGSHTLEVQSIVSRLPAQIFCEPESILVVRHLLEHARNLDSFLHGLWKVLGNESICLIEVPNSINLLTSGDLTQLWEEHTAYFTSASLHRVFRTSGFDILAQHEIISDGEKLCLAVVRRSKLLTHQAAERFHDASAINFLVRLPDQLHQINLALATLATERTAYIFGANHIAGTFLDLIADGAKYIRGVIDDDPKKICCSLGLLCTPIVTLESIDRSYPVHLLVSVNQGRAPELYDRLLTLFPESNGHRVESLVSLSMKCWETL